jgi:hypothetical protein
MKSRIEVLEAALQEEIATLRRWADESVRGGWSTHQVQPMRDRANALALILCDATPRPAYAGDSR